MEYFTDREFQHGDLISGKLIRGTYDHCVFREIDVSESYIDGITFMDCTFEGCNLSNTKIGGSQFSDTRFEDCKLLGLRIENLGLLSTNLIFSNCQMDFISFSQLNLKGVQFQYCSLKEADFTEADLQSAEFKNCDLFKAQFYRTNLQGADFSSAIRIQLDPEENSIRKARFALEALPGLLVKYGINIEGSS